MIKKIIILQLMISMIFLTSCTIEELISDDNESDLHPILESRIDELNKNTEEEIADAMMEKILTIIKDEDSEEMKEKNLLYPLGT